MRLIAVLVLALLPLACADGCGCDCSGSEAPSVPETVAAPESFDASVNTETGQSARPDAGSETGSGASTAATTPPAAAELAADADDGGPVVPRNFAPNERIQMVQPPQIQLRPNGAGPNNLPNSVAPHIAHPQVREIGMPAARTGVDPNAITE